MLPIWHGDGEYTTVDGHVCVEDELNNMINVKVNNNSYEFWYTISSIFVICARLKHADDNRNDVSWHNTVVTLVIPESRLLKRWNWSMWVCDNMLG